VGFLLQAVGRVSGSGLVVLAVFGVGIEAWVWGWGMILGCLVWEKGGTAEELGFWGDGQVMATFFFCSLSLSLSVYYTENWSILGDDFGSD